MPSDEPLAVVDLAEDSVDEDQESVDDEKNAEALENFAQITNLALNGRGNAHILANVQASVIAVNNNSFNSDESDYRINNKSSIDSYVTPNESNKEILVQELSYFSDEQLHESPLGEHEPLVPDDDTQFPYVDEELAFGSSNNPEDESFPMSSNVEHDDLALEFTNGVDDNNDDDEYQGSYYSDGYPSDLNQNSEV